MTDRIRGARSTAHRRPNLLLLGAPKCGTTTLASWMSTADSVSPGARKEAGVLSNSDYSVGAARRLYDRHYASSPPSVQHFLDATPWLIYRPDVLGSAAALARHRNIRSIVSLRSPMSRTISMYRDQVRRGTESRPLDECLGTELDELPAAAEAIPRQQWRSSYLWTSLYGQHLARLEQPAVLPSTVVVFFELFNDPDYSQSMRAVIEEWVGDGLGSLGHENASSAGAPRLGRRVDRLVRTGALLPPSIKSHLRPWVVRGLDRARSWTSPSARVPDQRYDDQLSSTVREQVMATFEADREHLGSVLDRFRLCAESLPDWVVTRTE